MSKIIDAIKGLDSIAVANVNEPSDGDLARVLKQNQEFLAELDALKADHNSLLDKYDREMANLEIAQEATRFYRNEWESACERLRYRDEELETARTDIIELKKYLDNAEIEIERLKQVNFQANESAKREIEYKSNKIITECLNHDWAKTQNMDIVITNAMKSLLRFEKPEDRLVVIEALLRDAYGEVSQADNIKAIHDKAMQNNPEYAKSYTEACEVKPKTTFETALNEQMQSGFEYDNWTEADIERIANWSREFTRTELMNSAQLLELKESIEAFGHSGNNWGSIEKALSNFQAKFGSPTEGE